MKAMKKTTLLAGGVITVLASAIVAHGDVVIGDTLDLTFAGVDPGRYQPSQSCFSFSIAHR